MSDQALASLVYACFVHIVIVGCSLEYLLLMLQIVANPTKQVQNAFYGKES